MLTSTPTDATAVDLFAGAGGVTRGLKDAGLRVLAAVEFDPLACATYAANHSEVCLFYRDIRGVEPDELLAQAQLRPGELGLLTACAPCQGYSSLGKRRPDDPRNDLVLDVLRFVAGLRPRMVAFENVPRLRHDPRFADFVAGLHALGYGVWSDVVDAADFRVPQRRKRVVLIALDGIADDRVPPLRSPSLKGGERGRVWVEDAWCELGPIDAGDPLHRTPTYPPAVLARIRAVPPDGGSRKDLPPEHRLRCHAHIRSSAATAAYGRMWWKDVAPTMTTRCDTPACGRFLHPTEDRAITLREAAALQTFPPKYVFCGGRLAIAAQIGNAVPVRLAEAIGKAHLATETP